MKRAVVDQPGLKIIFLGLLAALFLGLVVRSQITESKINEHVKTLFHNLEKKNSDKKVSIDFAEAHLLLSDWGLPFPHLLIKNIKIKAAVPECADNQIYIETLDIPISWAYLLKLKTQLSAAHLGSVEWRLNSPEKCLAPRNGAAAAQSPAATQPRNVAVEATAQPPVEFDFYVEKLKIIDKHNYAVPVLLQTLGAHLQLTQGRVISAELRSQLYLFRDFDQSIYKLKSDFNLNYSPEQVEATVRGKLVDKSFEINLNWNPSQNKILVSHKMNELSLKAMLSLISFDGANEKFQKRFEGITGLVLSSQGQGEYNLTAKALDFYQIEKIALVSGESLAMVDQIKITSLKPITFEPFEIQIQNFALEKLKTMPAFASIQRSISDFGYISGLVKVKSASEVEAEGTLKGLQLIFSNRGQRANQKIDELSYKANQQGLTLNRIVMEEQPVEGKAEFQWNPLEIHADLSKIKLSSNVYDIFSFSAAQPTKIELMVDGDQQQVKSKIKFDQLSSSALEIKQAEVNYEAQLGAEKSHIFEMSMKELTVNRSESWDPSFYHILEELGNPQATKFNFEMVKAQYKNLKPELLELKITANYEKNNVHMTSDFKNSLEALFKVDLSNRGKPIKKFDFIADLSHFTFEIIK